MSTGQVADITPAARAAPSQNRGINVIAYPYDAYHFNGRSA